MIKAESLLLSFIDVEALLKGKNDLCQPLMFTTTFTAKCFPPSWAIYRCVTANMKVIKTQSQPNPSYFPKESFEEKSSVIAPINRIHTREGLSV